MDSDMVLRKLENWWEYVGDIKLKQFLLLALIIYMIPSIIRTLFDVIFTGIKSMFRMFVFLAVVALAVNLYFGNPTMDLDLRDVTRQMSKFFRKTMKSVFGAEVDFHH